MSSKRNFSEDGHNSCDYPLALEFFAINCCIYAASFIYNISKILFFVNFFHNFVMYILFNTGQSLCPMWKHFIPDKVNFCCVWMYMNVHMAKHGKLDRQGSWKLNFLQKPRHMEQVVKWCMTTLNTFISQHSCTLKKILNTGDTECHDQQPTAKATNLPLLSPPLLTVGLFKTAHFNNIGREKNTPFFSKWCHHRQFFRNTFFDQKSPWHAEVDVSRWRRQTDRQANRQTWRLIDNIYLRVFRKHQGSRNNHMIY